MPEPNPTAPPAVELPPAGPDEVSLLVDGRAVVVRKGTTVLQAAERLGIVVPHYCYHAGPHGHASAAAAAGGRPA